MQNEWCKWVPLDNVAQQYSLESLVDLDSSLTVTLVDIFDSSKKIQVCSEGPVFSYQCTDLNMRSCTVEKLCEIAGDNFMQWTFFKVENSALSEWLSSQSFDFIPLNNFVHVVLVTTDTVIDIVGRFEPKVMFVHAA